ncbi:probable E3 ubiquitin-protein ligase RHG1A [Ziziphus jujuba]|uniref:RING-type E3 ubiquitin transferase n=2 Tax=Ziziphus jujuba TaxID=326968 RepID=A0ABM3ILH1_ZIZJJ|nr:probable E3 ubiquitin-protein ligase RHG1A [Ziziphus jujuba]XP_048331086.1 probable E3 ubiquitin-protein ligase RHG1A [Ziziphus jujuba]KAH7524268.1 hypothetical protein FEM48_Zijuj06G0101400 [Ziziphus jujuba var. spinosa]
MDEYSGKRAVDGLVVSRKASSLVLKETPNSRDNNSQFCNRIGCNGRLNSVRGAQIEKGKPSRSSLHSPSSSKEMNGSSSRTCPTVGNPRKSFTEPCKKLSTHLETDSSETSSVQDEPEVSEVIPPPGKIQRGLHIESKNAKSNVVDAGSSSVAANTRSRRNFHQKSGLRNQDNNLVGPSVPLGSKSTSNATNASANRYGLKNLRCNSISDVVPSNCSSDLGRRRETVKKRNSEGESSSSARGKKINGSPSVHNASSNHGITISDSRRARNAPPNRDNGVASVRTRRSISGHSRARLSNQGSVNSLSCNESSEVMPGSSQPEIPIDINASGSSRQLSTEAPLVRLNSHSRPGSSGENLRRILPSSPADGAFTRMNRESLRRYTMDGIAEVLLALDRIEHDEELTFEQILLLETNLFLNGLNVYDQHRDMRLDIDNMSYEELLALEERMGSVSTALTEEALAECIKRSIYESVPPEDVCIGSDGVSDDVKCSICQEEYLVGDEVGRLQCEHRYHVVCIHQWLCLKNWCPICKKAAAEAASPSTTLPTT